MSTKTFEKAVTGFNHNIKHKGKVYHVQTEDSGRNNPHIITHLFVGGNILASKKTSYADIVSVDNLAEVVRGLMEEQHKEMLRNLINGVYDTFENASGGVKSYQPGQLATDDEAKKTQLQSGRSLSSPSVPAAAAPVAPKPAVSPLTAASLPPVAPPSKPPPEVLAAREMAVAPRINEVGAETLFGEDLISEKSLDEVILSYLAGGD